VKKKQTQNKCRRGETVNVAGLGGKKNVNHSKGRREENWGRQRALPKGKRKSKKGIGVKGETSGKRN